MTLALFQNDKASTEHGPISNGAETPLVPMPVSGRSMWPTLHPGDILWVRLAPTQLQAGDIALFRCNGELFSHRFLAYRHRNQQRYYLAKGDGHWAFDPPWPEQAFFGVAESIERNGVLHPLTAVPAWQRWCSVGLSLLQGAIHHMKHRFFVFLLLLILLTSVAEASVSLTTFTATFQGNGVLLHWETASEVNALGFNLYRSPLPSGEEVLLNPDIILAQGEITGSAYDYLDDSPPQADGYRYRLEEIDASGQIESFTPVSIYRVTPPPTVTPSPTKTPVPPTATATATAANTLTPTSTATQSVATPTPTFTASPVSSSSPSPTLDTNALATPTQTLTNTPIPTNTPISLAGSTSTPPAPIPSPDQFIEAPSLTPSPLAAVAAESTPTPTQLPMATTATVIVLEPTATPTPIRFPDSAAISQNPPSDSGGIPSGIFAIVGIFSLLVAGILVGILIVLRQRWHQ